MSETPMDRFKDLLDERGYSYGTVVRASGLQVDQQVELQVFGQRMVVTKAHPFNDPTHTRLVAHILCPLPEELMMMLDRMCGNARDSE